MSTIKYFVLSLMMLLMGCQKDVSYSYLMHHPNLLKEEIKSCQSDDMFSAQDQEKIKYCQTVMSAAENMIAMLNEQQANAEKFGQKLLSLQMKFSNTKIALIEAEKNADKNADNVKRDRLKKQYEDERKEIELMLAVIGINSPE